MADEAMTNPLACPDCGGLEVHLPTCRWTTAAPTNHQLGSAVVYHHFATRRQDLADLRTRILALLYERSGTISVAEAVGILEIAKMELFMEQKE